MTQIVLTSDQIALLSQVAGPVVLVDANGHPVGQATRSPGIVFSPDRIAAAKTRLGEQDSGKSTAEVLKKLQAAG